MLRVKIALGTGVVALALISEAPASAHVFKANFAPGELVGSGGEQEFSPGNLSYVCEHLKVRVPNKDIKATKSATLKAVAEYEGNCHIKGFESIKFTVTPAHYKFFAEKEQVEIESPIVIRIGEPWNCSITVPKQKVKGVTYTNENKKILIKSHVEKIHYEGSGGLCPSGTNAVYIGNALVEEVNKEGKEGGIEWK